MKLSNINASILLAAALTAAPANAFVSNPSSRHISPQKVSSINFPSIIDVSPRSNLIKLQAATVTDAATATTSPFAFMEGKRRLGFGMAFLTGVSDLALTLKYKCFATMMTGNTMWMALAMMEQRFMDVGFYATVIMSYLAGLAIYRRTDLGLKKKSLPASALLTAALFVGSDVVFSVFKSRWIPTMMLAAGFGIVNSVGQDNTGTLTFVITGSITRMMNQVVDRFSRTAGRKKLTLQDMQGFLLNASIYAGFFCGAAFAAILKSKGILVEKTGVFSGVGLSYAALFLWKYIPSLGDAWWKKKEVEVNGVKAETAPADEQLEDADAVLEPAN